MNMILTDVKLVGTCWVCDRRMEATLIPVFSMGATDGNLEAGTLLNKSLIRNLSVLLIKTNPSGSLESLIMLLGVLAFSNDLKAQTRW